MIWVIKVVHSKVWGQQPKKLCHDKFSEMSLECSKVFVKQSEVNENRSDLNFVELQEYFKNNSILNS